MASVATGELVQAYGREGIKELVKSGKMTIEELERDYNKGYVSLLLKDQKFMSELRN